MSVRPRDRTGPAAGAAAALALVPAAAAFGISFGVLARASGLDVAAAVVMSATTFGGSAQFAAASVLGAGGGVVAAVTAALVLNARYAPIGLSVAAVLPGRGWQRALKAQLIVDESWALSRVEGRYDGGRLIGAGLVLYAAWTLGTLVGAAGGSFIGDPTRLGMDAAFLALFLALLLPQLTSRQAWMAAVSGAVIAGALVPLTPPGVPVIAAAAGVLAGWKEPR